MRRHVSLLALAAVGLVAVGCGGNDSPESIFDNAVGGDSGDIDLGDLGDLADGDFGDIDLGDLGDGEGGIDLGDLLGDDGFSIDTGEGSVSIDEDGNFVITDENGEVITGDVNLDGNGIDINTDDGSFSMETDGDGNVTMETDDGTTIIGGESGEIPEDWPSSAPEPTGFTVQSSAKFSDGTSTNISVSGMTDDGKGWFDQYSQQLLGAGFSEQSVLTNPDSVFGNYEVEGLTINLSAFDNTDGTWTVSVNAIETTS